MSKSRTNDQGLRSFNPHRCNCEAVRSRPRNFSLHLSSQIFTRDNSYWRLICNLPRTKKSAHNYLIHETSWGKKSKGLNRKVHRGYTHTFSICDDFIGGGIWAYARRIRLNFSAPPINWNPARYNDYQFHVMYGGGLRGHAMSWTLRLLSDNALGGRVA